MLINCITTVKQLSLSFSFSALLSYAKNHVNSVANYIRVCYMHKSQQTAVNCHQMLKNGSNNVKPLSLFFNLFLPLTLPVEPPWSNLCAVSC